MEEKQISEAVLEELKKLNSFMKAIQMDINSMKSVTGERGLSVHVSGISDIPKAIDKLAARKF